MRLTGQYLTSAVNTAGLKPGAYIKSAPGDQSRFAAEALKNQKGIRNKKGKRRMN